jgi:large subunit ribosomal protein L18e
MAEKNRDKVFVVAGTVMGNGEITKPLKVAAFKFTVVAKTKITGQKGKAFSLDELMEQKIPGNKIVLVK